MAALDERTINQIVELVVNTVIQTLEDKNLLVAQKTEKTDKPEKTAYQKTEQLLYNYNGFKRIVGEKMTEIDNLRKYGVPKKDGSIVQYSAHSGGTVRGIVLEEESVEVAVRNVLDSVQGTIRAIDMINKAMSALSTDPYYKTLEMRYFEGRTLEDIAADLKCGTMTVSRNKSRLVKELSMRLFPDQVISEYLN